MSLRYINANNFLNNLSVFAIFRLSLQYKSLKMFFTKFVKTEIIGTLAMAKLINRDTDEIGTSGVEKRENKRNESNQNLQISFKMKDVLSIPFFADEDIHKRAKR